MRPVLILLLAANLTPGLAAAAQPGPSPVPEASDQVPAGTGEGAQAHPMRGQLRQACAQDMATYCADTGTDRQARRQCMSVNMSQFSQGCRDAIAKFRAARAVDRPMRPEATSPQGPQ